MNKKAAEKIIKISARRLAEIIHRSGGLATPVYGGVDSLDGIRLHQKFTSYLKEGSSEFDFQSSELSLTGSFQISDYDLKISGRLDNLTIKDNNLILYEIKSFRGNSIYLPKQGDPVHWAQLKVYANLIKNIKFEDFSEKTKKEDPALLAAIQNTLLGESIDLSLIYISVEHDEIVEISETFTWYDLEQFMQSTCAEYISRMKNIISWQGLRDESIQKSDFPFDHLRDGQREMMRQSLAAFRDNGSILIQAPTGIGKTMATLYPALKAVSVKYVTKVFYATAMIATREVAGQSLDILREHGFLIRSILLQSKEKLCTQPDLFCDYSICPFAVDYYQRLPDGLADLLVLQEIKPAHIIETALKHQLCPHELSLDMAQFCDVIIGDYNHIFDPQAKIGSFFNNTDEKTAILVDEAHNLPSRSKSMYSANIKGADFLKIRNLLKHPNLNFASQYGSLIAALEILILELEEFNLIFKEGKKPQKNKFLKEELKSQWLIEHDFIGIRQQPDLLLAKIGRLNFLLKDFLDEQRLFEGRRSVLDFWFDLLFFIRVSEDYFDQAYITAFRPNPSGLPDCYLLALDTAKQLSDCYLNKHPTVFFSATLSPINYYHSLLNSEIREQPSETLILPSPFPVENRLIGALTGYSVRYKDRAQSMPHISQFILDACQIHLGNYLVFVPSYQYLSQLEGLYKKMSQQNNIDFMFQTKNMSEFQKKKYLQRFDEYGKRTLLAFAVLGSHFNEGIDLQSEKLSGVFVIGTGLPSISPEREIMTQYYAEKYEGGRAYGYQYPGFNRVQQAVGRLIRSESDIGFAVLIDDRYNHPEWQDIFPNDWLVKIFEEKDDLLDEIKVFWQDRLD